MHAFLAEWVQSGLCPAWLVALPRVYHRPPSQLAAAASVLHCFCTSNCIWSLVTEAKEKCELLRDERGAELAMLLFT